MRETDKYQYGFDQKLGTDTIIPETDSESIEGILESIHQIIEKSEHNEKKESNAQLSTEEMIDNNDSTELNYMDGGNIIDNTEIEKKDNSKLESIEDLLEQKLRFAEYHSQETSNDKEESSSSLESNKEEMKTIEIKPEIDKQTNEILDQQNTSTKNEDYDDTENVSFVNIKENNFSLFTNKDEHSQVEGFIKNIIKNWLANDGRNIIIHQIEQYVDLYIEINKDQINKIISDTLNKADYEKIIIDYTRSLDFQDQINKLINNQIKSIFKNFVEN